MVPSQEHSLHVKKCLMGITASAVKRGFWTATYCGVHGTIYTELSSASGMDRKLCRSFLPDGLELCLLLVAERTIKALERGAHHTDRLLHGIEPTVHSIKANG